MTDDSFIYDRHVVAYTNMASPYTFPNNAQINKRRDPKSWRGWLFMYQSSSTQFLMVTIFIFDGVTLQNRFQFYRKPPFL